MNYLQRNWFKLEKIGITLWNDYWTVYTEITARSTS